MDVMEKRKTSAWNPTPGLSSTRLITVVTELYCLVLHVETECCLAVKFHCCLLTVIFLNFAIRCQRLLGGMACWMAS